MLQWRVETDRRSAGQRAYRVVVGRNREDVAEGRGDCWDSGKVVSDRATATYDGPDLDSDAVYYWTVRVWNESGDPGPFAVPERFETALGSAADWPGEWIGH